tara:strand:+ start:972 stop:1172 length:201 start_codon:yes stop_codon:yes gene_type:complete
MLNNIIEKIKSNLKTLNEWTKEPQIALGISWVLLAVGYFFSSVILFILALGLAGYGVYLVTRPESE